MDNVSSSRHGRVKSVTFDDETTSSKWYVLFALTGVIICQIGPPIFWNPREKSKQNIYSKQTFVYLTTKSFHAMPNGTPLQSLV